MAHEAAVASRPVSGEESSYERAFEPRVSAGIWIAIAGVIVGAIGIGATVLAARRWGNRRRKILFAWEQVPLLAAGADHGLLEVTYRDIPVENPHLVTVRVANVGASDVASDHFDAGLPLIVHLNCTMYGVTRTTHPQYTAGGAIGAEGRARASTLSAADR